MKIIKNVCFGGFSLSNKALLLYFKKRFDCDNPHCYIYNHDRTFTEVSVKEALEAKNEGHLFLSVSPLSDQEIWEKAYFSHSFSDEKEKRTDPTLVEVVEELKEAANGEFARLKIVEIPDDVKWKIENYDGVETIREISREW